MNQRLFSTFSHHLRWLATDLDIVGSQLPVPLVNVLLLGRPEERELDLGKDATGVRPAHDLFFLLPHLGPDSIAIVFFLISSAPTKPFF